MTILRSLMILALTGSLVTACSNTTLINSWTKPDYTSKVENVYLIGIAKESEFRRLFEEDFKRKLSERGVQAVASYNDLPGNQQADRDSIIKAMTTHGCDSILLTRLIRRRTDEGTKGDEIKVVRTSPVPLYIDPWYRNWGGYYNQSYSVTTIQPTTPDTVTLTIESVLYDLKTEERIWSAQLETVKEIDFLKMIRNHTEAVTRNLRKNGLI